MTAIQQARQINTDTENSCFDFDYIKHMPQEAKTLNIAPDIVVEPIIKNIPPLIIIDEPESQYINIIEVWDQYKESNKLMVGKTTQISTWKQTDNCLEKVSSKALNLENNALFESLGKIEETIREQTLQYITPQLGVFLFKESQEQEQAELEK